MARYIDADRLLLVLEKNFGHTSGAEVMKDLIDMQPTADVQPIVYCRNCKFYNKCDENLGDCMKFKNFIHCVGNDWYCNFGARMDGDTNDI